VPPKAWREAATLVPLVGLLMGGCSETQPITPQKRALPSGVVARVDSLDVVQGTVAAIAEQQQVPLERARQLAIYDALLARGARADLAPQVVTNAEDRVLARALLRLLWAEAEAAPITDAELSAATERHWTELDRPEGHRTVHAVVHADAEAKGDHHRRAMELAQRIREAVGPTTAVARSEPSPPRSEVETFTLGAGPADSAATAFIAAGQGVAAEGLKVDVQLLPPLGADHHPIERGNIRDSASYAADFTAAAKKLGVRGDLSDVIKSPFGYHVIMLLEITPAKHASKRECLELLEDEIRRLRGRQAREDLIGKLRKSHGVETATNADALTAHIRIAEMPEEPGADDR
jgi:hypothetical protein